MKQTAFSLQDWQAQQIDPSFPEDDVFEKAPHYGQNGIMLAQIRKGNGCLYAIVGYMPHRYAKKIVSDFETQWLLMPYRHMWE